MRNDRNYKYTILSIRKTRKGIDLLKGGYFDFGGTSHIATVEHKGRKLRVGIIPQGTGIFDVDYTIKAGIFHKFYEKKRTKLKIKSLLKKHGKRRKR